MRKTLFLLLAALTFAAPLSAQTKAEPAKPAPAPDEKPAVTCKRALEVYGYIKMDAAADTGIYPGNYAAWSLPNARDNKFYLTAKDTRLGLNFLKEGGKRLVSGKIEIDFFNAADENKGAPMMRHAYLEISCPEKQSSLLAGQTWDVIAPLNPTSINYSVYWWAGNIGYRRPQLRFTHFMGPRDAQVTVQAALARTIGDSVTLTAPVTSIYTATGEDSGYPTAEGRLAFSTGASSGQPLTLGLWGHFGQEEYGDIDLVSSSVGGDLSLGFSSKIDLKSEVWWGKNLDAYLGGVGQGISKTASSVKEVHARGGWVGLTFGPFGSLKFYGGAGVDAPRDEDLANGARGRNSAGWGGILATLAPGTRLGMEYSYFDTQYVNSPGGFSHRGQVSFIYDI